MIIYSTLSVESSPGASENPQSETADGLLKVVQLFPKNTAKVVVIMNKFKMKNETADLPCSTLCLQHKISFMGTRLVSQLFDAELVSADFNLCWYGLIYISNYA